MDENKDVKYYGIEDFDFFNSNWKERIRYAFDIVWNETDYDKKKHMFPLDQKIRIKWNEPEDGMAIRDTLKLLKRMINNIEY